MSEKNVPVSKPAILAARCHEIQVSLGNIQVPEFESIPAIGQAVRLSLHVRGLPLIQYNILKLVASHYLSINSLELERILRLLADVQFVRLNTDGKTIKSILPTVPYYEDMYDTLGEYAKTEQHFNEAEQLAVYLVEQLSRAPQNVDSLRNESGAEARLFSRGIQIGTTGNYLVQRRARGRDILINPTYFSENADIFIDAVASQGASSIRKLLESIRAFQGWPLSVIESSSRIGSIEVTPDQVQLLKRLAQDGAVKPPSIVTDHAGQNFFIFTPAPSGAALSPTKRDVYEKAMAVVAAVRQGQLLPKKYAIRSPAALINKLRTDLRLSRATTEAAQQYKKLVDLHIGQLVDVGFGYHQFIVLDTRENREALEIAYSIVHDGTPQSLEVDEEARIALQKDQIYIESIIASAELRRKEVVRLTPEDESEIERLFLGSRIR